MNTTLEGTVEQYAESLARLIDALKAAGAQLRDLQRHQEALDKKLSEVGRVISYQPDSDETDHALSLLSWVMRSSDETLKLADDGLAGTKDALPQLEVQLRSVVDLISSLRSATGPMPEQPERQAG